MGIKRKIKDRSWLYRMYWNKKLSMKAIASMVGCTPATVLHSARRFGIPTRAQGGKKKLRDDPFIRETIKRLPIKSSDARWLAAVIDCEGWLGMHKSLVTKRKGRKIVQPYHIWHYGIQVYNTNPRLPHECIKIAKVGWIQKLDRGNSKHRIQYWWNVTRYNEFRRLVATVKPYLILKRKQADLILSLPPKGVEAPFIKERICRKLMILNRKGRH